ncbi:MAG: hypothetical protein KDB22_11825 [Planctomycetales bacterium]|nr:hypothetical protein [Planctomycetales bacterium]
MHNLETALANLRLLTLSLLWVSISLTSRVVAQALPTGMTYETRVALVRGMLEPSRAKAEEDATEVRQKYPNFLQFYADIDPAWTAQFILENPNPNKEVLYDNNAIMALMKHASELPRNTVRQLIEAAMFMRASAALTAIESLPEDRADLRSQIITWGLASGGDGSGEVHPIMFESLHELAKHSKDVKVQQRVRKQIAEYFDSGKHSEFLKSVDTHNRAAYLAILMPFAGEGVEGFETDFQDLDAHLLGTTILRNDQLSDDGKRSKLAQAKRYNFGAQTYERIMGASQLGLVAQLDIELALKWADQAPDEMTRIWAKLTIVPAIAKLDPQAARKLAKECYEEMKVISSKNSNELIQLAASPACVAGLGLFIVQPTCPEQVDQCVEITISVAKNLRTKTQPQFYYSAIAAVAPFAPQKAREMYLEIAMDVQIGYAGDFLKAVLAVEPEAFLEIVQTLPDQDRNGNSVVTRVHNAIIPALLTKEQAAFNAALASPDSFLQIPGGVL